MCVCISKRDTLFHNINIKALCILCFYFAVFLLLHCVFGELYEILKSDLFMQKYQYTQHALVSSVMSDGFIDKRITTTKDS